jgi:hypothetical protein
MALLSRIFSDQLLHRGYEAVQQDESFVFHVVAVLNTPTAATIFDEARDANRRVAGN